MKGSANRGIRSGEFVYEKSVDFLDFRTFKKSSGPVFSEAIGHLRSSYVSIGSIPVVMPNPVWFMQFLRS